MFGIQQGWTAPTLVKLKETESFAATTEELSWIATSLEIGRFFGPILAALLVDRIGRKYTLIMCSFSFFISWVIMIFASSMKFFYCLRMLQGVIAMANTVSVCIFLAENCTPKMRGPIMNVYYIFANTAVIIEYVLTTYTSLVTVAIINAAIGFCGLSTCLFLRETPYFLIMKGCNERARKSLMWLRGKRIFDNELELELNKIDENIQLEMTKKKSTANVLLIPENYKSVSIVIILIMSVPLTGYLSITAYSSMIFQSSATFSSREYTIILGIFPLGISVILPFIIERYNRRNLLICLSVASVMSHAATFSLILTRDYISKKYFPWFIFISIATYVTVGNLNMILTSTISGEILPMSVKAIGHSLGGLMFSITTTISVAIFLPITESYGMQYNFLFYTVISIFLFAFVLIVLPETRGKSLVDIQNDRSKPIS